MIGIKNIYPTWYLKIAATPPNALKSCIPSSVSVEISSTSEFISSAFSTKSSIKVCEDYSFKISPQLEHGFSSLSASL